VAFKTTRQSDELRRGARVESERIDDLDFSFKHLF